jgi:hypothetical protein
VQGNNVADAESEEHMKTTIDMAREVYGAHTEWSGAPLDRLEQLVALARADQREIDAKVCESLPMQQEVDVRDQCAAAIRARGKT